jgi:hypothetical protein
MQCSRARDDQVLPDVEWARYLSTGAVVRTFRWKRGPLYAVAFSPDGLICAVGAGRVVWDVDA